MKAQQIQDAWESQQKECHWEGLSKDEAIEFALAYIEETAYDALNDLGVAVYDPDNTSISVAHAIDHVRQVFYTCDNK